MKTLSQLGLKLLQLALQSSARTYGAVLPISYSERALPCSNDFQFLSECFVAVHVLKL